MKSTETGKREFHDDKTEMMGVGHEFPEKQIKHNNITTRTQLALSFHFCSLFSFLPWRIRLISTVTLFQPIPQEYAFKAMDTRRRKQVPLP